MVVNTLVQALLIMTTVGLSANSSADERPTGYDAAPTSSERATRPSESTRPELNQPFEAKTTSSQSHQDDEEEMD